MSRSCKDGRIDAYSATKGIFILNDVGAIVARAASETSLNGSYGWTGNTRYRAVLYRYNEDGTRTQIATGPVWTASKGQAVLSVIGAVITCSRSLGNGLDSNPIVVTDATFPGPGDWRVHTPYPTFYETAFECYDAPAPSGIAHPVIGSGIINSRAIVRGAL